MRDWGMGDWDMGDWDTRDEERERLQICGKYCIFESWVSTCGIEALGRTRGKGNFQTAVDYEKCSRMGYRPDRRKDSINLNRLQASGRHHGKTGTAEITGIQKNHCRNRRV